MATDWREILLIEEEILQGIIEKHKAHTDGSILEQHDRVCRKLDNMMKW
jgi:hypothetical protein